MSSAVQVIFASLKAGQELLQPPREGSEKPLMEGRALPNIPIRTLSKRQRAAVSRHLLALDAQDRYLRFGYVASDAQISKYVAALDFDSDAVYGIYNRRLQLVAVAHVAFAKGYGYAMCAEFGVSVLPEGRRRGFGARLFQRAAMHATNEGVRMMFIHALSENTSMLKIAKKAGAVVEHDGPETEAYLSLPTSSLDSRITELIEDRVGQTDYALKVQAKQFWSVLAELQAIRADTLSAQKSNAP
jgi:GNAT superfamily N-acetyltransferase